MKVLDQKLEKKVMVASKKLGLNQRDFINRSVSAYLTYLKQVADLKKELTFWDTLSAESFKSHSF